MELKSPSSSLSWILGNFLSFLTLLLGRQPHRMSDFVTHMSTFIFVTKFFHFFGNWTACRHPPFLSRSQRNIGMTMKSKSCVLSTHESGCTLYSKMAFAIQCNGNSTIWNRAHVRSYLKKSETSYQRHRKQWTVNISVSFHQNSWNFVSKISYFSDFVMRNKIQRVN